MAISRRTLRLVALGAVLLGVAIVAMHPHWNLRTGEQRELPVHMDEYVHWGWAESALTHRAVNFGDPFWGSAAPDFELSQHLHERGFHAYLAALHELTGVPWTTLLAIVPTAIALLLALSVYCIAERWGAGVEAALWVAAIPTTLRFLGPGFVVPVAVAMPLVVVGLHFAFHEKGSGSIVAFGIVSAALWPIHAMGAGLLFATTAVFAALRLWAEPMRAGALIAIGALPFLVAIPYQLSAVESHQLRPILPTNLDTALLIGLLPLALAGVGGALLALRGGSTLAAGVALGGAVLASELIILLRSQGVHDPLRTYDRVVTTFPTLVAILAGVGIAGLRRELAARLVSRPGAAIAATIVLILAQGGAVAASAREQMGQPYYEILTPDRFDAYVLAAELIPVTHGRALVEGPSTMPFSIITGRPTAWVATPGSITPPPDVRDFFASGSSDTYFLITQGVSIVATTTPVHNPDLREIAPGVYILREDYVELFRLPSLADVRDAR